MLGAPPAFESRALRISNGDMDGSPKVGKRKGGGLRSLSHDERQRFFTASCVCAWFLLNMTIANLNKWIFHQYAFHQPALLTFLHMAACWVLGRAAMAFCFKPTLAARHPSAHVRRSIRSLSVVFVVSVASSNAALKYIHVSFSQSIGATAPMWTVLLSVLITGKAYPLRVYGALLMVSLGMLLCTTGEVNFHPLGFALENYDIIGRWRDKYPNGRAVDASGTLIRKYPFDGAVRFKEALVKEEKRFAKAFTAHLLRYAISSELSPADSLTVEAIVEKTGPDKHRLRALIREILLSESFLQAN